MKVKVYYLQFSLLGYPPAEVQEYDNKGTRDAIQGHLHNHLGPLLRDVKTWEEEQETAGNTSSEQPALSPELQGKLDSMEPSQREAARKLLNELGFGGSK